MSCAFCCIGTSFAKRFPRFSEPQRSPIFSCTEPTPSLSRRAALQIITSLPFLTHARLARAADYDKHASSYDILDGSTPLTSIVGFDSLRTLLLRRAKGSVIELGVGTGVNIPYYPSDGTITSLTAVDQSSAMLNRAVEKYQRLNLNFNLATTIADASATSLPSTSFDTVVATFCLCVVSDAAGVAREIRRLVKNNGTVLVLDYTRSSFAPLAVYQDITATTVKRMSKGCAPNLDLTALLGDVGLAVVSKSSTLGGLVVALELQPSEKSYW